MGIGAVLRRFVWGSVVLFGVTAVSFTLSTILPSDPARMVAGPKADDVTVQRIRKELGLDRPVYVQYLRFLDRLAHGDLGRSYVTRQRVLDAIGERLPATLFLAGCSWVAAAMLGIAGGCLATLWARSEAGFLIGSLLALSVPPFWLGLLLLYFFAYRLGWFPLGGYGLRNVVLPAAALAMGNAAYYARLVHSNLGSVLEQDFIRTAYAKGLNRLRIYGQHALRNALIPVITVLGLDLAGLMSGVVLTETIFNWPGVGRLAVEAVFNQDIPMIMGTVLFSALLVVGANLLVDLIYQIVDPRVRLGGG